MFAPLSQFRAFTPLMLVLSLLLTAALSFFRPGDGVALWTDWCVAGIVSYLIWRVVSRFDLRGGSEFRAFGISWPTIHAALCFSRCHLGQDEAWYIVPIQLLALVFVVSLTMSLWQRHSATTKHLLIGLLIGLTSCMVPHVLLWLLFVPVACYHLRCWSPRNLLSALTGAVFAIWVVYCILFLAFGVEVADALLPRYYAIVRDEAILPVFAQLGLWQGLYLGFVVFLVLVLCIAGFLISGSQSVRASSTIHLYSSLCLLLVFLLCFDVEHLFVHSALLVLFLAVLMTILQANVHSALLEWSLLVVILLFTAFCLMPYFLVI